MLQFLNYNKLEDIYKKHKIWSLKEQKNWIDTIYTLNHKNLIFI